MRKKLLPLMVLSITFFWFGICQAVSGQPVERGHATVHCWGGDPHNNYVTIKWGHPNKDNCFSGFPFRIDSGATNTMDFPIPLGESEFEIQTQGGHPTSYDITIKFDNRPGEITMGYHGGWKSPVCTNDCSKAYLHCSSAFDSFGEGNMKVFLEDNKFPPNIGGIACPCR